MSDDPTQKPAFVDIQKALPRWSILADGLNATFRTGSFVAGTEFVTRIADLAEAANHHPDVDLRYGLVHVRTISHDVNMLTRRDVDLAERITAAADALGLPITPSVGARAEIVIDTHDATAIRPFWRAVLGYENRGDDLIDPAGIGPVIWFSHVDEPPTQRNRIHLDVWVHAADAEQRVADTIAAGGRVVAEDHVPSYRLLADADGNEAWLCTWQGRG